MAATLLNDYPACAHSLICTAHPHNRTHKTECGQNCSCLNECCHCGDYLRNSFQILNQIGIVEFVPFIRLWCLMSTFAERVGSVQWLNRSFRLKLDAKKKKKKKAFPSRRLKYIVDNLILTCGSTITHCTFLFFFALRAWEVGRESGGRSRNIKKVCSPHLYPVRKRQDSYCSPCAYESQNSKREC